MPNGPAHRSVASLSQKERDQIKKQDALKMQMICLITHIYYLNLSCATDTRESQLSCAQS